MLKLVIIYLTLYIARIYGQNDLNSVLGELFNKPGEQSGPAQTGGGQPQGQAPTLPQKDGDYSWGLWGQWSACRTTCGLGQRLRQRTCFFTEKRSSSGGGLFGGGGSSSGGGLLGGLGNIFDGDSEGGGIGSIPPDILELVGNSGGGGGLSSLILISSLMGGGTGGLFGGQDTNEKPEEKKEDEKDKPSFCVGEAVDSAPCQAPPCPGNSVNPAIPVITNNPAIPVVPNNPPIPVVSNNPPISVVSNNPPIPIVPNNPSIPVAPSNPAIPVVPNNPTIPVVSTDPAVPVVSDNPGDQIIIGSPVLINPVVGMTPCMGEWGSFGQCTSSCGRAIQFRARKCSCKGPNGKLSCTEPLTDHRACVDNPPCGATTSTATTTAATTTAASSKWSPWGIWTGCPAVDCGVKTSESRYRGCIGDSTCEGEFIDTRDCPVVPCPVPKWSEWGSFSKCSETCGSGTKVRFRSCNEPGNCEGPTSETQPCQDKDCPKTIESKWEEWGPYSSCTTACGPGQKFRYRACSGPTPCIGDSIDIISCTENQPCISSTPTPTTTQAPSAKWSDWNSYSACTATCGPGTKSRARYCIGLGSCDGEQLETTECEVRPCVVATESPAPTGAYWGTYSSWGECKPNPRTNNCYQERYRACIGGRNCPGPGSFVERRTCTTGQCDLSILAPTTTTAAPSTSAPPNQQACEASSPQSRRDCGFPGITREQCWAKGCCYSDALQDVPWCFHDDFSGILLNTGGVILGGPEIIGDTIIVLPDNNET